MLISIYLLGVVLFTLAFAATRMSESFGHVIGTSKQAFSILGDPHLDDDAKEQAARVAAWNLLKQSAVIFLKGAVTVACAVFPFWAANALELSPWSESIEFALRWDVLGITTLAMLGFWFLWHRWVATRSSSRELPIVNASRYSRIDRLIHRMAFGNYVLQDMLSDMETKFLAGRWVEFRAMKPIFITSLPRAGTTITLEALHRLPGLASNTYRDMPFLFTPVLWDRLSATFRRRSPDRERAHGDGLWVNEDSPEAFEEALWQKFYANKYSENRIALWHTRDVDTRFTQYLHDQMKKIISIRQPLQPIDGRYLSKNNTNIARIDVLRVMYPDAFIIVMLRHPVEHAISMWRQHHNFVSQHAGDTFIEEYTADLGHYEFGPMHKLIAFDGLRALIDGLRPESVDYWLAYWISAFEHLARQQGIRLICYESLCESGTAGIAKLVEYLEIQASPDAIASAASVFRPAPPVRSDTQTLPDGLINRALKVYEMLQPRCLLST